MVSLSSFFYLLLLQQMLQVVIACDALQFILHNLRNHSIFRLDIHRNLTYLCAVTFKNNDYGKRESKLPRGI